MKCLVRERIDVDGEPRVSYLHKVWASDISDEVIQEDFNSLTQIEGGADTAREDIPASEWQRIAAEHEPQATYPNSEWGDGLPGAGAKWASTPAWER